MGTVLDSTVFYIIGGVLVKKGVWVQNIVKTETA